MSYTAMRVQALKEKLPWLHVSSTGGTEMAEKATGKSVGEVEVQLKRGSDYGVLSFLVGSTTMLGDTEDEMKKELGIGHEALLQSLARLEGAGLVTSAICQTGTASLSRRYQATKGLRIRLVREFQTVQQM